MNCPTNIGGIKMEFDVCIGAKKSVFESVQYMAFPLKKNCRIATIQSYAVTFYNYLSKTDMRWHIRLWEIIE